MASPSTIIITSSSSSPPSPQPPQVQYYGRTLLCSRLVCVRAHTHTHQGRSARHTTHKHTHTHTHTRMSPSAGTHTHTHTSRPACAGARNSHPWSTLHPGRVRSRRAALRGVVQGRRGRVEFGRYLSLFCFLLFLCGKEGFDFAHNTRSTHTYTRSAHTHTLTHSHTRTLTLTHSHTHTHSHTLTHTHPAWCAFMCCCCCVNYGQVSLKNPFVFSRRLNDCFAD